MSTRPITALGARLELIIFSFTFRKPGEPLQSNTDRRGDPGLKKRIKTNTSNQHDAIVTWIVEGAIRWYADPDAALLPTFKITEDTRAWRKDADRILGFWDQELIADDDHCILATELLEEFNRWLAANGHEKWSKETFGPRFAQHTETSKHRVTKVRPRQLPSVSRPPLMGLAPIPTRPEVWQGVRFQTPADKEERESGQTGQTLSETISYTRSSESFQNGLSGLTTSDHSDPNDASNGPECFNCSRALSQPHSIQLGMCETCYMHADPNQESATA